MTAESESNCTAVVVLHRYSSD